MFSFFREREEHKIAQDVLKHDPRLDNLYQAKRDNNRLQRLLAALIATIIAAIIIFLVL